MATATERIPVLVTPQEKAHIAQMAREANLSMGEYLRRAAAAFRAPEDERLLAGMIEQMLATTARANKAMDEALALVAKSEARIEARERKAGAHG
ncbi:plasmid mobilization protein [Rhodocyclaceae bacterium SMB388]